jgi:Zn-dependent membrane protease YugP
MHPAFALVPILTLVLGPRLWVGYVLKQHNRRDEGLPLNASELARELLDKHGLHGVRVELTDLGDHYDPMAKAVRISRDKYQRRSLTAITTAAHETAHALQDASGFGPFLWRTRLVKVAQRTGEVGMVLLLSVPAAALLSRDPLPPAVIGGAALAMLATGLVAQLATLPCELDASFRRALPMLRQGYIGDGQAGDASEILFACSLTYVASSLLSILNIWPWVGRPMVRAGAIVAGNAHVSQLVSTASSDALMSAPSPASKAGSLVVLRRGPEQQPLAEKALRRLAKPLIRGWIRLADMH